jgi:hypothetical protein
LVDENRPSTKALKKPSLAISKQQEKKLAENKSFKPHVIGKKALEKPCLAISKQLEKKLAENKGLTPRVAGKKAL